MGLPSGPILYFTTGPIKFKILPVPVEFLIFLGRHADYSFFYYWPDKKKFFNFTGTGSCSKMCYILFFWLANDVAVVL
jgi:hypothetical protein